MTTAKPSFDETLLKDFYSNYMSCRQEDGKPGIGEASELVGHKVHNETPKDPFASPLG